MVIIAICTDSGQVSAHFGRAPEYIFVTIENNKIIKKESFPNPGHAVGSIPTFVHEKGASYIIAGGMGPRAVDFFNQFGIEPIVGITGSVDEAINNFITGNLEGGASMCSPGAGKGYGVNKIHTEADEDHEHHHHPL